MDTVIVVLESSFRVMMPLFFAAMGGWFSERSGVVNIALEGYMLIGAFIAAWATLALGDPVAGFLVAGLAGAAFSAIYGWVVLGFKTDQIVAGTGMNLLAAGLTPFLCKLLYGVTGQTPQIEMANRLVWLPYGVAVALAVGIWMLHRFSWAGLFIDFSGEKPEALEAAGIRVIRVRWISTLMAGLLAAWGGAILSIWLSSSFSRNMTAGRGFIALAALILGKWKPVPTLIATFFLAFTEAIQIQLQGLHFPDGTEIPVQWIQMMPYLVTLLVLAGFIGTARAPRALGGPTP